MKPAASLLRRAAAATVLVLSAFGALAQGEAWWNAYQRGVTALGGGNHQLAAEQLQKAIAEKPEESATARVGNETNIYVPHFWLGIARYHLGDIEAALREFRMSEEHGAIRNTRYAADLRAWRDRAEKELAKAAGNRAADARREAASALKAAVSAQMQAVQDGGDRSSSYLEGQKKLQEARDLSANAGDEPAKFRRAGTLAEEARSRFVTASREAKQRAARSAAAPPPQPPPATSGTAQAPEPEVVTAAVADVRVALQAYRRLLADAESKSPVDRDFRTFVHQAARQAETWEKDARGRMTDSAAGALSDSIARAEKSLRERLTASRQNLRTPAEPVRESITTRDARVETAWRAYASGDLARAEALLTEIVDERPSAEAHLIRGCGRRIRALQSRTPDALNAAAAADFRSALRIDPKVRLDPEWFPPAVVSFFETIARAR